MYVDVGIRNEAEEVVFGIGELELLEEVRQIFTEGNDIFVGRQARYLQVDNLGLVRTSIYSSSVYLFA